MPYVAKTWGVEVSIPKGTKYVTQAERDFIASAERQRFEYREQAAYYAGTVRDFLAHRRISVRVVEVTP